MGRNREGVEFPEGEELLLLAEFMVGVYDLSQSSSELS